MVPRNRAISRLPRTCGDEPYRPPPRAGWTSLPRTCGDEPGVKNADELVKAFAPHLRG